MDQDNIIDFKNPVQDALTEFLKDLAQKMLQAAIEQEVNDFLKSHHLLRLDDGRQRVVRNGYLPERDIQTGIGNIEVNLPRVRDRKHLTKPQQQSQEKPVIFQSTWIPKYMRRTATLDSLLPLLYLKGISTGDFQDALEPILGKDAANLSPSLVSRMKSSWLDEYQQFLQKDLSHKNYVYF